MSRSFTRPLIGVPVTDRASGRKRAQSCWSDRRIADGIVVALGVGAGEAEAAGTDPPGPPDLPAPSRLSQAARYFGRISLAILAPSLPSPCVVGSSLTGPWSESVRSEAMFFSGRALILKPGCQASLTDRQVNPQNLAGWGDSRVVERQRCTDRTT